MTQIQNPSAVLKGASLIFQEAIFSKIRTIQKTLTH